MPGWVFCGITGAVLILGLYGSSVPPGGDPAVVIPAFLACLVIGLVWTVAFALAASETRLRMGPRQWVRWMAVPAAGILVAGIMLSGAPAKARFDLSRPAMEDAAARAREGQAFGPGWIGLMAVDEVIVESSGNVVFVVTGTDDIFGSRCGYIFGSQPSESGDKLRPIAPGWETWCRNLFD